MVLIKGRRRHGQKVTVLWKGKSYSFFDRLDQYKMADRWASSRMKVDVALLTGSGLAGGPSLQTEAVPKLSMPKEKMRKLVRPIAERTTNRGQRGSAKTGHCSVESNDAVQKLMSEVESLYNANKNDSNAGPMKQYLRGQFEFLGMRAPQRRQLDKQICAANKTLDGDQMYTLIKLLWNKQEREYQHFGMDYCMKYIQTFMGTTSTSCRSAIDCTHFMICNKSWWDTVDMIASKVVGPMVQSFPHIMLPVMDNWIEDDNMWLRRTAIIHQLNFKQNTDEKRLFSYCLKCAHEKEFFIRKAIGWSLRQYYRENKTAVKTFVNDNTDKLSNLSKNEALKHDH